MNNADILQQRLHRQHLTHHPHKRAVDVVTSLVAMQAQEYAGAKWALGLRLPTATDDSIDAAFNNGEILRTHVLRPTWHFVAPKDIRWLLQLTSPHIHALSDYYYRQKKLDKKIFAQCHTIIEKALQGNNFLTREELKIEFEKKNIITDTLRLAYIMMHAELEGLICSGPRRGKQFTYALMDERVPATATPKREEALALFTQRYFTAHGPATVQDFAKWSGLKIADARLGLELAKSHLLMEKVGAHEFWYMPDTTFKQPKLPRVWLLPTYDEFVIGYKVNHLFLADDKPPGSLTFDSTVLIDGIIKGSWHRTLKKNVAQITLKMFTAPDSTTSNLIETACDNYAVFFGLKAETTFV